MNDSGANRRGEAVSIPHAPMINLYYTKLESNFSNELFDLYLNELSISFRKNIMKRLMIQDRLTALFGKLLLLHGLKKYGYEKKDMDRLSYNTYGRPFIDSHIDFNISHSDAIVICAISFVSRVGIDIEKIRDIKVDDFDRIFTESELNLLKKSTNCIKDFFRLWTIKESIIKADGSGLSTPLNTIRIYKDYAILKNKKWFLKSIYIDNQYQTHLAIEKSDLEIQIQYIDPYSISLLLP